jgi:hypothetical protein
MEKKKPKAIAVPVALYPEEYEYVERVGIGNNFSKKLRSIIRDHLNDKEGLAIYDEDGTLVSNDTNAMLVYEKRSDETVWADTLPFPADKKSGWRELTRAAAESNYRIQIYENKESGYVAVWVAPAVKSASACKDCKSRLTKFVEEL